MVTPPSEPAAVLYACSLPADSGGALILHGLREPITKAGYSLRVAEAGGGTVSDMLRREHEHLTRCAADPGIVGAVVMLHGGPGGVNLRALKAVLCAGKPVVLLGRNIAPEAADGPLDFVTPNDFEAAFNVVTHLIARGHRSIAHITNHEGVSTVAERRRGYESALAAAGLPPRPELVLPHETDALGRIQCSPDLLSRLLSLPEPPTALFAVNDWVALNALLSAHLAGHRIPQDLAVAGFDSIARFRPGAPLLTSVEQPFEAMGRHAALLLLDRLRGKPVRVNRLVYLDAPLRVHESTDTPSGRGHSATGLLTHDGAWRTRLVHHFIRMNVSENISLPDLAAVAGVSPRRLLEDFHRYEGMSPIRTLHNERLELVRWHLEHPRAGRATVTQVASHFGVQNLGRFSALYRSRYGELSSETLRRGSRQ